MSKLTDEQHDTLRMQLARARQANKDAFAAGDLTVQEYERADAQAEVDYRLAVQPALAGSVFAPTVKRMLADTAAANAEESRAGDELSREAARRGITGDA